MDMQTHATEAARRRPRASTEDVLSNRVVRREPEEQSSSPRESEHDFSRGKQSEETTDSTH
jgi:hypothetical protein